MKRHFLMIHWIAAEEWLLAEAVEKWYQNERSPNKSCQSVWLFARLIFILIKTWAIIQLTICKYIFIFITEIRLNFIFLAIRMRTLKLFRTRLIILFNFQFSNLAPLTFETSSTSRETEPSWSEGANLLYFRKKQGT